MAMNQQSVTFVNNTNNNNTNEKIIVVSTLAAAHDALRNPDLFISSSSSTWQQPAVSRSRRLIALDCEGLNLGRSGQVSLVQIGTIGRIVYIFDMLVVGMESVLKSILESQYITKVIHDCRSDAANLLSQFGIQLTNVFDTQIAYQVTRPDHSAGGTTAASAAGSRNNHHQFVGFNKLCSELQLRGNHLKDTINHIYRSNRRYWLKRPLTPQMIDYASSDIFSLLDIHSQLVNLIPNLGLFKELCDQRLTPNPPRLSLLFGIDKYYNEAQQEQQQQLRRSGGDGDRRLNPYLKRQYTQYNKSGQKRTRSRSRSRSYDDRDGKRRRVDDHRSRSFWKERSGSRSRPDHRHRHRHTDHSGNVDKYAERRGGGGGRSGWTSADHHFHHRTHYRGGGARRRYF